jgi:4-hydroxybenzoyl-CoA thioesterase
MNKAFTKSEKIRFKHVDYAGIVFYPRFLEMLNDLVEDWFEEALDRPFSKIHETNGIPTVDLKVQFKKAARLGEVLTKSLWVIRLGGASVTCGFQFKD